MRSPSTASDIALVLWPGVQYRSGQAFDLKEVARLAHAQGCVVGFDLAHAAGNLATGPARQRRRFRRLVQLQVPQLRAGRGGRLLSSMSATHARERPRFAGWWGHDKATRFRMGPEFVPTPGADGWQLSNPPILALAPLRVSLEIFQRAGMTALRAKSERLTGYLEAPDPRAPGRHAAHRHARAERERRGCQLSLRVIAGRERGRALFEHLAGRGIIGDWREPDVIRISPTPLYNRFTDVLRFVQAVEAWRQA